MIGLALRSCLDVVGNAIFESVRMTRRYNGYRVAISIAKLIGDNGATSRGDVDVYFRECEKTISIRKFSDASRANFHESDEICNGHF